jgi:hypothetical protein
MSCTKRNKHKNAKESHKKRPNTGAFFNGKDDSVHPYFRTTTRHHAEAPLFITTLILTIPLLRPLTTPALVTLTTFFLPEIVYFLTVSPFVFLRMTIRAVLPFLIRSTVFFKRTVAFFLETVPEEAEVSGDTVGETLGDIVGA